MNHWHVNTAGKDHHQGDQANPFRTIQRAAEMAMPGDTVIVHAGCYREWVRPARGGESDLQRITYRAAAGEQVVIKGSEQITGWQQTNDGLWQQQLPDTMFPHANPYRTPLAGDWFIDGGRVHHTGEIFLEGQPLREVVDRDTLLQTDPTRPGRWLVRHELDHVVILANFQNVNPNQTCVEVSVRPACFYPEQTGVNWITVSGFEMCQAATPWAPPTAEQIGIIGPHWAKGWVIENNYIHHAKCTGISLGKERSTGQNQWTELKVKHGTQRERDIIFKALQLGWSGKNIGSHVVKNNRIEHCGQTGICGHLGAIFSTIVGNHIAYNHTDQNFGGHEMAGIKIHAAIDTLIADNHLHHNNRGIWLDWQAQGTRVCRNLMHDHPVDDLYIEVSHGPYLIDHNILLSNIGIKDCSQGGAFAHNLIAGKIIQQPIPNRFTPYHFPHDTAVMGLMTILGGDNRYYHNLFIPALSPEQQATLKNIGDENADLKSDSDQEHPFGLAVYNPYPCPEDDWCIGGSVNHYAIHKLPVHIAHNYYANGAAPYKKEHQPQVNPNHGHTVSLQQIDGQYVLTLDLPQTPPQPTGAIITTETLGQAFQTESPYYNPDGTPIRLDHDYFGHTRSDTAMPGPFQSLTAGKQQWVVATQSNR